MGIENIVKTGKATARVAGAVLPLFQAEDMDDHVEYLIKHDPEIRQYVERNPGSRDRLLQTARDVYKTHKKYIVGAKLIDSWDRVTSAVGGLAETVPVVGQAASALEELIELPPKIVYGAAYAVGTGDYASIPYFAGIEAASFTPYVGDLVDMANLYIGRARKTFRSKVKESFLASVKRDDEQKSNVLPFRKKNVLDQEFREAA